LEQVYIAIFVNKNQYVKFIFDEKLLLFRHGLSGFTIIVAIIYELLKTILS